MFHLYTSPPVVALQVGQIPEQQGRLFLGYNGEEIISAELIRAVRMASAAGML